MIEAIEVATMIVCPVCDVAADRRYVTVGVSGMDLRHECGAILTGVRPSLSPSRKHLTVIGLRSWAPWLPGVPGRAAANRDALARTLGVNDGRRVEAERTGEPREGMLL